jgi:hypothetical protein
MNNLEDSLDVTWAFNVDGPQLWNVRPYEGMFVNVGGIVERPEKWQVPSLVRFERPNKRYDLWGQVLAPPSDAILKITVGSSDRKVGTGGRTGYTRRPSRSRAGVIESAPEILESISGDIGEFSEVETGKHYLELFKAGVRIYLGDMGVTVSLDESVTLPFHISDVLLCSI